LSSSNIVQDRQRINGRLTGQFISIGAAGAAEGGGGTFIDNNFGATQTVQGKTRVLEYTPMMVVPGVDPAKTATLSQAEVEAAPERQGPDRIGKSRSVGN
jgi:hypothetical protein